MPKKTIVTTENELTVTPPSVPSTPTISDKIKEDYINGLSPLQCALKHNVEIADVLEAINQQEMLYVQIVGDQIDSAGPGVPLNPGTKQKINYTKN